MTDVGRTGEAVAAKYYQQRGWLLLNHNYRTRLGELDLILYKENTLVFAEVKTRTGAMLDRPAAAVDARKQNRLILAASNTCSTAPTAMLPSALMWWRSRPPPAAGRCIASRARLSVEPLLALSARGLPPQRVGERTLRQPHTFRGNDGHRPLQPVGADSLSARNPPLTATV